MAEGVEAVFTDEPTWIVDPIGKKLKIANRWIKKILFSFSND